MSLQEHRHEQLNCVILGHVDHGKSTLIGRLLADTGSLPEGKLEQVRLTCERNAKPFEYAFLLDALKDEQAQGITIDTARVFFKTDKRHYIIMDAPGHIEFLKNMVTGAARAEAALLLIDAHEGIQENSRRHGFLTSLLGLKQLVVLVNKMDLVNYDQAVFNRIQTDYTAFLDRIGVQAKAFIPIAAREGDNLASRSSRMGWYTGPNVVEAVDGFEKPSGAEALPFRFPVQDIYKFTEAGDDRRIIAGTVETGTLNVGDEVVFYPSGKRTHIQSIEGFNTPAQTQASAGMATGFTMSTQLYLKPGEIMCRVSENRHPQVGSTFKANLFWLGKNPLVMGKKYKLKLGTSRATVYLKQVLQVVDASDLSTETNKREVERHDVAEVVLQTVQPIAFDLASNLDKTGRFVLVDDFEITGGGIVLENITQAQTYLEEAAAKMANWDRSLVKPQDRATRLGQKPKVIVITGDAAVTDVAKQVEKALYDAGKSVYYLGLQALLDAEQTEREDQLIQLAKTAHWFADAGLVLISALPDLSDAEGNLLKTFIQPYDMLVVSVGDKAQLDHAQVVGGSCDQVVEQLLQLLQREVFSPEYYL
ncbi:MAG: GTP-binding protein [Candidatus Margulisiibacteriota bacterium]